jgi:hypothetical protein
MDSAAYLIFLWLIEFKHFPLLAFFASVWMAIITSLAVVLISRYSFVLTVGFSSRVAAQAIKLREIIRIGMAIGTLVPFTVMASAVNREILVIMIKGRWDPCELSVAQLTISWISS